MRSGRPGGKLIHVMYADDVWIEGVKGPQISRRPAANTGLGEKQKIVENGGGKRYRGRFAPICTHT